MTIDSLFLKSSLNIDGKFISTNGCKEWLEERRDAISVNITKIAFDELKQWHFDPIDSNLKHVSGKFFSIEGISVETNWGNVHHWQQPIINQPEIGYLGILTKQFDGVLYFLMQAKIEPGNINFVQLSPTLQATKSNYTRVHKGKSPLYLEYFQDRSKIKRVLLDQLQSEQGARFLRKRNRNIIIEVEEDVEVFDDFCWLTLGQIQKLLQLDNVVNMDTRTVISGVPYGNYTKEVFHLLNTILPNVMREDNFALGMLFSAIETDYHLYSNEYIISWFTDLKSNYDLNVKSIPLEEVEDWCKNDHEIKHDQGKYFKVIPVLAEIENREVKAWTQPLVESVEEGIIATIVKEFQGIYHFLVQAKLEPGNLDILEMAPTVQCLTGNYKKGQNEYEVPFLQYVLENEDSDKMKYSTHQSEEGGRFFREQNKNMIVLADDSAIFDELPENYIWMTINQIKRFIQYNNYLNIQARSILSAINFRSWKN